MHRAQQPGFWAEIERDFLASGDKKASYFFHSRRRENRTIAQHFHDCVHAGGRLDLCAYCDGPLGETSPPAIDHFIPESVSRDLALWWNNLYPACTSCNSSHKRDQWACWLLRPDVDPVEKMIDFDPETGALMPAIDFDRKERARVRLTLRVLGLNTNARRAARKRALRLLRSASEADIEESRKIGPYRMVADRMAGRDML